MLYDVCLSKVSTPADFRISTSTVLHAFAKVDHLDSALILHLY